MKYFVGIIIFAIIIVAALLAYIYSGIYNISAADPHTGIVHWVFETTIEKSVKKHSKDIETPDLEGLEMIKKGAVHYKQMCEVCHAAPGVKHTELAKAMNPEPPELVDEAEEWSAAEIFWITKYGIKMTGMPAWGNSHSDDEIWAITAFIKQLPKISTQGYINLTESAGDTSGQGGHQH